LTNAEVVGVIDGLFNAAGVIQVISVDDMYADEAPVDEAVAAYLALEPAEPGVCAAVFGDKAGIDFRSDPAVVREQIHAFWKTIEVIQQRDILQELRSKLSQEDDVDKGAKSSMAEFFGAYDFTPLSRARWESDKEGIFKAGKALTLLLVDEDFSKESGGGRNDGLKIIKEVFATVDPKLFLCGLLSHGYSSEDIHKQWNELCVREALDKSRFVLIPKKLLDEGADGLVTFLRLVKLAILNGPAHWLKQRASKIFLESQQAAAKQLDEIDIYDFDQIVFRSSEKEGVWEPDTLFRLFGLFHRDQTRRAAKLDTELHKVAKEIRVISQVPTHSPTAPSYNTWKVQRMELYEDGEYLNPYCLPIELGDIFEKSGDVPKRYVLLSQSCDLMVRPDGERYFATTEGLLAEIVKGDMDRRSHAELQYFDSQHAAQYFVSFKKVFAIRLFVLDLCALNPEGKSAFTTGKDCSPLVIPSWQKRCAILAKFVERALVKYGELTKKGVDPQSATALVAKCSNEDKIKGQIDIPAKTLSYPLRRIGRVRQFRAAALLARYANFVAREAFDHDFGSPAEEPAVTRETDDNNKPKK
jgi:hypothetical protein